MASFQRPNRLFSLGFLCISALLAACSSGGGKGSPSGGTDTTPDAFTLTAPTGVDLTKVAFSTPVASNPVTISGITGAAPVSIIGGEFAIGGGAFGASARNVSNGQAITVRVQSPAKAGQSATATLNVGGQTATFSVTTEADTTPPEVAILFPPPASMTEGQTLFLRGTVKDVHGVLEEGAVTVNGVAADLELNTAGDDGTWSVTVDLAPGENTVSVTAEDESGNSNGEQSVSSRRVAAIAGESFPDNQNPFGASINADIGWVDGKPVAYVADDTALKVFKVDLTTGVRSVLAGNEGVAEELAFEEPWGIHLGSNGKLYVSDVTRGAIFEVVPETGARTVIAASNEQSFWDSPTGLLLRVEQNKEKLYVGDVRGKVFSIDMTTKDQVLVVDSRSGLQPSGKQFPNVFGFGLGVNESILAAATNGIFIVGSGAGESSPFFDTEPEAVTSIAESDVANKIYYVNNDVDSVFLLDVQTKESLAVAGDAVNGTQNQLVNIWGITSHVGLGYLLVVDRQNGLIAMDHVSRNRVVVSKSLPL